MRKDAKVIEDVVPGSILQVNPKAELAEGDGQLCVVVDKQTWGVHARLPSGNVVTIAWQHVEKTGGRMVFAADGTRLRPEEGATRHHP